MKKTDIILIAVVLVLIIVSIFVLGGKKEEKEPLVLTDNFSGVKDISYSDYTNMLESDASFVLLIVREGCSYCEAFAPIIEEVSNEKNIPVHRIDTATLSDDEMEEFTNSLSYLKKGEWGTPTTLVLKGSEVIETLSGYTEADELKKFFDKNVKVKLVEGSPEDGVVADENHEDESEDEEESE